MKVTQILKEAQFDYPIVAIHGTSSVYLDTILSQGLNPNMSGEGWGSNLGGKPEQRDMTPVGGVYFTTKGRIASMAASDAARKTDGNELFVIASLQPKSLYMDEDRIEKLLKTGLENAYREQGIKPPQDPSQALSILLEYKFNNSDKFDIILKSIKDYMLEEVPSLESLFFNYPGIDDEIEEFIQAYFFRIASYLENTNTLLMNRSIERIYRNYSDNWDSTSDFQEWIINDFLPEPSEAEQFYKEELNFLSQRFQRVIENEKNDMHSDSFRITTPVNYRGNNKILTIFELYKEDVFVVDVVYGDLFDESEDYLEEILEMEIGGVNLKNGNYRIEYS